MDITGSRRRWLLHLITFLCIGIVLADDLSQMAQKSDSIVETNLFPPAPISLAAFEQKRLFPRSDDPYNLPPAPEIHRPAAKPPPSFEPNPYEVTAPFIEPSIIAEVQSTTTSALPPAPIPPSKPTSGRPRPPASSRPPRPSSSSTRAAPPARSTTKRTTTTQSSRIAPATTAITIKSARVDVNCGVSDILFVLDSTSSVRRFYERQKTFVEQVVGQLDIDNERQHIAFIIYSSRHRQRIVLGFDQFKNKSEIIETDNGVTFNYYSDLPFYSGITATGAALTLSKIALEKRRPNLKSAVVVLTDGFSYDYVNEPAKVLLAVPGNTVYVAGVADPFGINELMLIAGDSNRIFIKQDAVQLLVRALKC